jgi:hypothetical protein
LTEDREDRKDQTMYGNSFRGLVCRIPLFSLVLAAIAIGLLSFPLFPAGRPGGQFPQRPQFPSTLPNSLPGPGNEPPFPRPGSTPDISIGPKLNHRQKNALIRDNFLKTKDDVARLSKMVRALQQAIERSNANILSVSIVKQANRVEKLAKRIKAETKGY